MPRKLTGTLTLSNLTSTHTSTHVIILYKSCYMAIFKYSETLLLVNYVRVVAYRPDLRVVSFYGIIECLKISSMIYYLFPRIYIERSNPIFTALVLSWKSL